MIAGMTLCLEGATYHLNLLRGLIEKGLLVRKQFFKFPDLKPADAGV